MLKLKNKYFILRHGETAYQTKKRGFTYPWPDNPPVKLTKKGEKEIKKIAKEIKKIGIDLIYSSDVFRARQTAGIVTKELGLKVNPARGQRSLEKTQRKQTSNGVNFDKRLRDINLGIYNGKMIEEFYHDFPFPRKRFYQRPKGGESWNDVKKRMINFIKEIDKKYKNKNILIISHGDPLWLLEGAIKGWNSEKFLKTSQLNYIQSGELRKL